MRDPVQSENEDPLFKGKVLLKVQKYKAFPFFFLSLWIYGVFLFAI